MSGLVKPHGADALKILLLEGNALAEARTRAAGLPQVRLASREVGDLIMLGIGGFTPLDGFMGEADWRGVCDDMQLASGLFWPIPITLSTDTGTADGLAIGGEVALVDGESGELMGTMRVTEKYRIDKAHECRQVFRTTDPAHPGVKLVLEQGEINLAGPVQVFSQGEFPGKYPDIYMTPAETRALFDSKGWSTVAAFQTREVLSREELSR
jgi:sulfate adenylyltransferase